MSCLITGAYGYVGTYLTNELHKQGISCLTPSHQELDISNISCMEQYFFDKQIEQVIHLAGAVETNNSASLFERNIAGLYNLLHVCGFHEVRHFSYASSNVVYGAEKTTVQSTKDLCAPDPNNLYAVSKYVGELLVCDYCTAHGINWANVRIADIYGPGQKYGNLIRTVIGSAVAGKPLKLYGAGIRKRDYIYITDVAAGLAFISNKGLTGNINLGTGIGTAVIDLMNLVVELSSKLTGITCNIQPVSVKKEDTSQIWLDVEQLKTVGFTPKISLRQGLEKCIEKKMQS